MTTGSENPGPSSVGLPTLLEILEQGGAAPILDVIRAELKSCEGEAMTRVRLAFSRLGRKVQAIPLTTSPASRKLTGLERSATFRADIVARMAFIFGLSESLEGPAFVEVLTALYRAGSQNEQVSVLRSLPFLPENERFGFLAAEACRTNDVQVFSALASDNPFPAAHMDDLAFFQMVLKAMFLGVDNAHTLGLAERTNDELIRMVRDFANERAAAGRTIPGDAKALLKQA